MRSVGLAQVALGRRGVFGLLRGLGVTCGAPPLAQKRSVGVNTGVIVEGSHAYPVLVGRGWGRQEMGCTHSLSCSVPF
ncbi:hypothetical protein T484DRAFT_1961383 [Baffinella frigidus]|nr:hypothetical protein T484DRAFT_1961383 [Cryptophyta sp. CCMP2293]